jgi:hypothetical protein
MHQIGGVSHKKDGMRFDELLKCGQILVICGLDCLKRVDANVSLNLRHAPGRL